MQTAVYRELTPRNCAIANAVTNRLLQALPAETRSSLLQRLEEVSLPLATVIYEPGVTPRYIHFMTEGITSLVTFMEDGTGVEVGVVGPEGLVEAFHLLGDAKVPTQGFVQVAGKGLRMSYAEFRREFTTNEALHARVLEYVQVQGLLVTQVAACNRLHEVEQRLARWLLLVAQRLDRPEFYLTQEFLAEMIGARRTTVTLAAGGLQRAGLIEYRRGNIRILDAAGLKIAACECLPIMHDLIANLYR